MHRRFSLRNAPYFKFNENLVPRRRGTSKLLGRKISKGVDQSVFDFVILIYETPIPEFVL